VIDLRTLGTMAGGLGLFMLGMGLMTDGLKLAADADARLALPDMEQALRRCSALRRATQQLHKSRRRIAFGGTP